MAWNAAQYRMFADLRLRPALDLLAQISVTAPQHVFDLGCGPGNVTALLADRWPGAAVTGIDRSAEMLAKATDPRISWQQADLASWQPPLKADVLFSNAAFNWLDDHATFLPRLMAELAPGGVLAVQMPRNFDRASHVCMADAAAAGPWRDAVEGVLRPVPVREPGFYYDVLRPHCAHLTIWETDYIQIMDGDNPVVEWTKGTALKPLIDAAGDQADVFVADYSARIQKAYPRQADGKTLFPFRRLFFVAET